MEVTVVRNLSLVHLVLVMLLMSACERTTPEEDITITQSIQTITDTDTAGTYVFESHSELSAFKADNALTELDIDGYDDAFFEHASLVIIVFDEEDTAVYPEGIRLERNRLEVAMIRTTEPLGNKTCFLVVELGKKNLVTAGLVSHEIRDAVMTDGLVPFTYDRYDSESGFAFEDWEHMSTFENNLHIINNTASFTGFQMLYPHMLPSDTTTFDSGFFESHTLLIIQYWAGAYYGNSVIVESVLIESHHATVNILITNPFGQRVQTIYSFWIVTDKNENITLLTYQVASS